MAKCNQLTTLPVKGLKWFYITRSTQKHRAVDRAAREGKPERLFTLGIHCWRTALARCRRGR